MLKKEITVAGVGVFSLCPRQDDVLIQLAHFSPRVEMLPITILWDEMTNYEVLYEKCKEMQLKSFKPVAEALGVMYNNRTLYEALLI
jgi:hypothetical protein